MFLEGAREIVGILHRRPFGRGALAFRIDAKAGPEATDHQNAEQSRALRDDAQPPRYGLDQCVKAPQITAPANEIQRAL